MKQKKRKVLLVTGLSGAGLSTALKALEDLGYKAVDNLPLALVDGLLSQKQGRGQPVAIGIDCRTWDFSAPKMLRKAAELKKKKGLSAQLVFINCEDGVLQQRFTETRRIHPLADERPVIDGIVQERQLMQPLRKAADHVIDTTDAKPHELRHILEGNFLQEDDRGLFVCVMSFAFRNGVPREADLVFDARFLDNPHWDPRLRLLSGRDAPVAQKLKGDKGYREFFKNLTALLALLLPRYAKAGKSYLTIAVGCTGGRHRSVFVAEELHRWLGQQGFSALDLRHRDLEKWEAQQFSQSQDRKKNKQRKDKAA